MVKEMTSRANLCKELIIWTLDQIVDGHNAVYVIKSPKALENDSDSVFSSTVKKPPQAGRAYRMRETIIECVTVEAFPDALAALLSTFAECTELLTQ